MRMLLAFCSATDRRSVSSSSFAVMAGSQEVRRERRPKHTRLDLGKRRVTARRRVVEERREPAVVRRAEVLERNVLGGFQHTIPHVLGGLDARLARRND